MKSIIYIGMDVHNDSYTLCSYRIETEKIQHIQKIAPDYRLILKYLEQIRSLSNEEIEFVCGYEAGCLGYTLYHQLTAHNVKCIILAPTTMAAVLGRKIKTDKRDAALIAKCLAYHTYSPVYVPTAADEQVKEYIRMRNDHKQALKKVKQQIQAFCMRHGYRYEEGKQYWTLVHLKWLKTLKIETLYKEILDEYVATCCQLIDKIERMDQRIEELATQEMYKEKVHHLSCFIGIKTHTALSLIVEVGDFRRFSSAEKFASYLGIVPGENSSGEKHSRNGITKTGNTHLRLLLIEAAQCYSRGKAGHKSKALKARQAGVSAGILAYSDKGNERLRRKFYRMVFSGKKNNVAKTAVARELACFIWGMMTENIT